MKTNHTLRVHAHLGDPESLPEVALDRLEQAASHLDFNVNVEARIITERPELGQPRHERIVGRFTFNPNSQFDVPVSTITETQARQYLGWTDGTYRDYSAPLPDGCDDWLTCEQEPPEKELANRPLPDTVSVDYYDDADTIKSWGIDPSNYFDTSRLVDDTKNIAVQGIADQVLHDVDWYVIYHTTGDSADGWDELLRHGEVPDPL